MTDKELAAIRDAVGNDNCSQWGAAQLLAEVDRLRAENAKIKGELDFAERQKREAVRLIGSGGR